MNQPCVLSKQQPGGAAERPGLAATSRSIFGYVVLVVFLLTQAADGVLTYAGVGRHGIHAEANPIAAHLMVLWGPGPTVTLVKMLTASMGCALFALGVPRILALIAGFYLLVAVLPWMGVLLAY